MSEVAGALTGWRDGFAQTQRTFLSIVWGVLKRLGGRVSGKREQTRRRMAAKDVKRCQEREERRRTAGRCVLVPRL